MFRQEKEILPFSKTPRSFLEPSHLSAQWVTDFTPKVMQPEREDDHLLA
jgi:hypothetical protein